MNKRVFFTGGTGLVGRHILEEYIRNGWEATVLTRNPNQAQQRLHHPRITYIAGDLTHTESYGQKLKGHDLLIHCGALHPVWAPDLEDVLTRTNVDATRDILSLAERAKVRRVIYTSSAKTIGWDSRRAMQDESVAYNFDLIDNEYGRAKARAEQIVMAFSGAMEIITLNPVAVLGAQDFAPTPTGRFLQKAIREPVHFHLGIQMQFVDAHDVARVHFAAATQGSNRERYILAAPPIPMRNVFNIIDALIGWKRLNIRVPLTLLSPLGYMFEFIARRSRFHPPVTRASAAVGIRKIILDGRRAENTFGIKYRDVRSALHESVIWFMGCCP